MSKETALYQPILLKALGTHCTTEDGVCCWEDPANIMKAKQNSSCIKEPKDEQTCWLIIN